MDLHIFEKEHMKLIYYIQGMMTYWKCYWFCWL